ncbi:MAG: HRDC domain-containing protein [Thermoguttaceae bacterium]|nr:HRDC domain-containing protein [Thermoguttaceae bacterium]
MQFKVFQVLSTDKAAVEELNLFLRSHRIVSVQKAFSLIGDACVWNFCVEYLDVELKKDYKNRKNETIDYKDVLSPSEFEAFNLLRDLRKELAQKEGVPVYSVCTNEQLAAMIQNRCDSIGALKKLAGFGEAKADKFGAAFLKILLTLNKKEPDETSGESDARANV